MLREIGRYGHYSKAKEEGIEEREEEVKAEVTLRRKTCDFNPFERYD